MVDRSLPAFDHAIAVQQIIIPINRKSSFTTLPAAADLHRATADWIIEVHFNFFRASIGHLGQSNWIGHTQGEHATWLQPTGDTRQQSLPLVRDQRAVGVARQQHRPKLMVEGQISHVSTQQFNLGGEGS